VRILACSTFLVATCVAQTNQSAISSSKPDESLKKFLQRYLKDQPLDEDQTTRYVYFFVDLKGDGKQEAIVYITGRSWCGSGGCPTLILAPAGPSYRIVSKILITRPPIRVLTSTSNGWHSKTYPLNPSVPPARRLTENTAGEIVVRPSEEGTLLYP
jgi:hypothetical protein